MAATKRKTRGMALRSAPRHRRKTRAKQRAGKLVSRSETSQRRARLGGRTYSNLAARPGLQLRSSGLQDRASGARIRRRRMPDTKRRQPCPRTGRSKEPDRIGAMARRPARRPASSSAKRSSTFVGANTARVRQSRPSRLVYRKLGVQAWTCRHRRRGRHLRARARKRNATMSAATEPRRGRKRRRSGRARHARL
jgi:hypothetical protein